MHKPLFPSLGVVALLATQACGAAPPTADVAEATPVANVSTADPNGRFAGAWSLSRIERRDADGALIGEPTTDQLGYLIYDAAGYMGVTLMRPDRVPYSPGGPTSEEALAQLGSYTSYFGTFTVNDAQGFITHHLEGSSSPRGTGSDYQRFYSFDGNTLTLQPPAGPNGAKAYLSWEKLPDLPASELTDTHRRLFGFYRVESVARERDGESIPADQYETAYIIYAPSGHMSVHLMRPGHAPYAGDQPTPEEALRTVQTYGSYFGPFSVHEDEGYLVHHRVGSINAAGSGTDAQRFFELTDTHLTLRPPARTDDTGRSVQSTLRWARISE